MQFPCTAFKAVLLLLAVRSAASIRSGSTVQLHGYGPGHCVTVARSATGSCILRTRCEGQDTSRYDFQFDCVGQHERRVRHSLGVGSFDEAEEFDTEVQCQRCLPPASLSAGPDAAGEPALTQVFQTPKAARTHVTAEEAELTGMRTASGEAAPRATSSLYPAGPAVQRPTAHQAESHGAPRRHRPLAVPLESPPPELRRAPSARPRRQRARISELQLGADADASNHTASADGDGALLGVNTSSTVHREIEVYGPSMCVSTWRDNKTGHCVLMTDCLPETDLSNYNFGFICVPVDGSVTRHLYGKNSFESHETYYTDVPCKECRALDDAPMSSIDSITGLLQEVAELKAQIMNISAVINNLKAKSMAAHLVQRAPPAQSGARHPSRAALLREASPRAGAPLLVERQSRAPPLEESGSQEYGGRAGEVRSIADEADQAIGSSLDAGTGDQAEAGEAVEETEQVDPGDEPEEASQDQSGNLDGSGEEELVQDE